MKVIKIILQIACFVLLFPLFAEKDISIITTPAGAGVFYDGKKIGVTPLNLSRESSDLPVFKNPGKSYDFILYKEFFEGEIVSVSYDRGKKNQINIDLQYLTRLPLYDGTFQVDSTLNFYDLLINDAREQLAVLRNEIYAKYGGKLDPEFKTRFESTPWYKENPYFTEEFFSTTDAANLELIIKLESTSEEDNWIMGSILSIGEFTGTNNSITFHDRAYAAITYYNINGDEDGYYPATVSVSWKIVDGTVYLWDTGSQLLYYVILNHDNAEIEQFEDISYEYYMENAGYAPGR